jgi:hypothetical protein
MPRSKESTKSALDAQLEQILSGAPSAVAAMVTASGVKDKYFQHFSDQLSDACAKFKDMQQRNPLLKGREFLVNKLQELRDTMPQDLFSPSLRLDGLTLLSLLDAIF